jgi:hypothetical protein
MKNRSLPIVILAMTVLMSCSNASQKEKEIKVDENGYAVLSDEQVENIIRRSYQYVAMYNVNNKMAFAEGPMSTHGYNKGMRNTDLLDHTAQFIARPNNDVLYQTAMLDLRKDAVVFKIPAIESKYVSLMATAYDHYVNIPLSTVDGDFKKPVTILFYSARTEHYKGQPIEGVDEILEMTGDFVSAVMRVTPHANEEEKYIRIVDQINSIEGMTLSEFLGSNKIPEDPIDFPAYGQTDADIFENNLLEVMQFVFNHTTFDAGDKLDSAVLAAYKPLGIEPGKEYNADRAVKINGKQFREASLKIRNEELTRFNNPKEIERLVPTIFQPKGTMPLESVLVVSVVGPIGQPAKEAMYPPVVTADGLPMNALNDYVIRMEKDELPPANAFWSLTLYDTENGFFIPNEQKKYSVGENAGMKPDDSGGIDIYISAEKPKGVPDENWLPINRLDQVIDVILRIYAPDLEKMKSWKAPKAEKI